MQTDSKDSLRSAPSLVAIAQLSYTDGQSFQTEKPTSQLRSKREYGRIALASFVMLQMGMCEASLGALLPSMKTHFNISYSTLSLVFLVNVIGWAVSAPCVPFMLHRIGMKYTLLVPCLLNVIGGVILVLNPPFPAAIVGLSFLGIAGGASDSAASTYIAQLKSTTLMSAGYACISIGALVTPMIIAVILGHGAKWCTYYYAPIGVAVFSAISTCVLFNDYSPPKDEESTSKGVGGQYKKALLSPAVMIGGALMALSFATSDITNGWIVSFLIDIRHGEAITMRYILAGFWGGQIVGRLCLAYPISAIENGEKIVIPIYLIICIGLLSILQFVKSLVGNAIAIALVGVFSGPVSPSILAAVSKHISPAQLSPAVATITTLGLIGSAVGPLIVGLISSAGGLKFLGAILMGVIVALLALWMLAVLNLWKKQPEESCKA